jgi:hypothetical protein
MNDSIFIKYLLNDKRYLNKTVHELKLIRAKMIKQGVRTEQEDYVLALVQWNIMNKEGRSI